LICGSVRKSLGSVTAQHIWCGLLKTSGEFVWTRLMGCDRGSEFPMATTVSSARPTRDGGAILAGTTTPYPELGTVDSDIWMAKLDETGAVVWAKSFDQDEGDDGADVAETPEGEFIIAGDVGPDWQHKNVLAMKTDADGAVVWQKQFGTATEDGACALVLPKEGGSFLACMSTFASGTWTGWGLRLNSDGRILWQSLYRWKAGTSAYWEASVQNASQTADGGYLVAGYTSPRGSWIENGFVLHLLSNGKACSAVSKPAGARVYPSSLRPVDVNLGAVGLTFAVKKPKATVRVQTIAWDDQCR
jgi:hypothetical protein